MSIFSSQPTIDGGWKSTIPSFLDRLRPPNFVEVWKIYVSIYVANFIKIRPTVRE